MNPKSPCSNCFRRSTRREWIKRLAMSYPAWAALSGSWGPPAARAAVVNFDNRLRLNLDAFPSLALPSSSAIITFDAEATLILITRESDTDFFAMDPHCTHMGCVIEPYSIVSNTSVCPCHGSEFDIHGQVVHGPAVTGLNNYATQFEGPSTLNIEVPGLVHRIDEIALHSSSPGLTRMRLSFPTMVDSMYQVRYSPDLASPFEVIGYATTPDGIADQTVLSGTGSPATVFADAAGGGGFFTLELLVYQLTY